MHPILLAAISVAAMGLVCGVVLVVAQKFMGVKEDETILNLRACLPGANCGACGYAGCDGYAKALAGGEAPINRCIPGADAVAAQLAEILGVEAADVEEQVARVACCGGLSQAGRKQEYHGVKSCVGAKSLNGGDKLCPYGCLGYGDCVAVCPHDAICIKDGLAHVIAGRCVGCGLCAAACPNCLIHMTPATQVVFVVCSSAEKGAATRKACTVGCIGCKKCEKACPADAIRVENNLASIDPVRCTGCGQCATACPSGCILVSKTV